jgi:CitB family two-component system response regulator MalR
VQIPKGLDRNTLRSVWEAIVPITGAFTTEELSALVGISRVSIRKYLDFLKSLHVLSLELHRGAVGRPVYKFKCIDTDINLVNHFFQ